jgi:hypothetical protein
VAAGVALAGSAGVDAALDAGWAPGGAVPETLAPPLAWALFDRGRVGEARAAVTRVNTPTTSFHRAAIADLEGDLRGRARAWAQAERPPAVPAAPGVVWRTDVRTGNFVDRVVIGVDRPTATVVAAGAATGCEGAPVLRIRVGGRPPVELPIGGDEVSAPLALEAGAYRLEVGWENDLAEPDCDRNITAATISLR